MSGNDRRGLGNHPVVVLISVIASIIAIIVFLTGKQRLSDFLPRAKTIPETPGSLSGPSPSRNKIVPSRSTEHTALIKNPEPSDVDVQSSREILVVLDPEETKDIWTTSVYSYGPNGGGPGGGLDDEGLRVGGWGDLYYSLIWFKIEGLPRAVLSAHLNLYSLPHQDNEGPCPLLLDRILEPWDWKVNGTGPDHERLWWADRPKTQEIGETRPAPEPGTWYSIDITDIYNSWQQGDVKNYGLQIRPTRNDHRGSIFVSSEGASQLRPRLVLRVKE
jgi:hypothetical protein